MRKVWLAAILSGLSIPVVAADRGSEACPAEGGVRYICSEGPEDILSVPHSPWVVTSSLRGAGGVYLVDSRDFSLHRVFPGQADIADHGGPTYPDCPGPPDTTRFTKFITHGIALRSSKRGEHTLFAVHHGDRESVEVFRLSMTQAQPRLRWIGCIPAPSGAWLNSVTTTPDGGVIVTNFRKGPPMALAAAMSLSPDDNTGEAWEWHPGAGWRSLAGTEAPGPNGVLLSRDGKWLYMAAWLNRSVIRVSRGAGAVRRQVVPLGFMADNLRWGPDGKIYVAGQGGKATHVVRLDPENLKVEVLIDRPDSPNFGFDTVAVPVAGKLWIGSAFSNRIAVMSMR